MNDHIQAALAAERRRDLLAEAEAARRAKQARSRRQWPAVPAARRRPLRGPIGRLLLGWRSGPWTAASGKPALLRDGSEVLIRPVQGTDAPLLADGFARLSARSRQMRFLGTKNELSPAELRYFTDIDHYDHEALGAVDRANGRGVGVARYVRSAQDARSAEIAVTVVDEWQGRGLGTELLAQLSERARDEDIRRGFTTRGPHRADWSIAFEHAPRREHFSRGQEKLCALGCILGQAQVFADGHGEWPVVCIDDLASELDGPHQEKLVRALHAADAQILVTGTHEPEALRIVGVDPKRFHVEPGKATRLL